jgi:hypothetical protein
VSSFPKVHLRFAGYRRHLTPTYASLTPTYERPPYLKNPGPGTPGLATEETAPVFLGLRSLKTLYWNVSVQDAIFQKDRSLCSWQLQSVE